MAISLPNFVNNRSEKIHEIKRKYGHVSKSCEIFGIKYRYCDCFLE